jgi:class 3 adenylate cyclase/predicted ATPase
MKCSRCKSELPEASKFCTACGAMLQTRCPSCQQPNLINALFCGHCGIKLDTKSTDASAIAGRRQAERRQLTVLFCDIVDSTVLANRLDPEDLRELIGDYQDQVASAVAGMRGYVARFVGDGVVAYFGWPNADETHAESAVRAGVSILDAIRGLRVEVRIGIATGLVVVGDLVGSGARDEGEAVGATLSLAARLQALAMPGTIVVSNSTHNYLGRIFDFEALGKSELKGFEGQQQVWRIQGEPRLASRSEAIYGNLLVPLIGRNEEVDLLLRRWRQARSGEARVVLISGEAGIGKSRLIAELEQRLSGERHLNLRYFCSPHHQEIAFYPIISRWQYEAGFARGDTPTDRLAKIETALSFEGSTREDRALFGELLSVAVDNAYPMLDFSQGLKKKKQLDAISRRIVSLMRPGPTLILFEDLNWADPSTLELLDILVDRLPRETLLLMSFRSEFTAPWIGRAGVSLLALSRLDRAQSAELAEQVAFKHLLPSPLLDRIVAQTDGVPLFIEELTRAVLDSPIHSENPALSVPESLQASLLARLDRIPKAKQVARVGAVIGLEFSHALLTVVARLSEAELTQGLNELVGAGLAVRRGFPPDATYSFKHILVQETVYDSLLRSRRAEIHGAVVAAVEADPTLAAIEPGSLGAHCIQAGFLSKAASYYRIAGEGPTTVETRSQLENGLAATRALSDTGERRQLEGELSLALGRILMNTHGPANSEACEVFARASQVGRGSDSPDISARALFALGNLTMNRGDLDAARSFGQELLVLGEARAEPRFTIAARVRLGALAYFRGQFVLARDYLSEALAQTEDGERVLLDVVVSSAPNVTAGAHLAGTLACLGYPHTAKAQAERTIEAARRRNSASTMFALSVLIRTFLAIGDDAHCRRIAEELVATAEDLGFPYFRTFGNCYLGWLKAKEGKVEDGLRLLDESLSSFRELEIEVQGTWTRCLLSDALSWADRKPEALAVINDGLALSARTGVAWYDAELHRRRGELLFAGANVEPLAAEAALRNAVELARVQSAKVFELRAAVSLSRYLCTQNRKAEAQNSLSPIFGWFTEGTDMPLLREAKTVLDDISTST